MVIQGKEVKGYSQTMLTAMGGGVSGNVSQPGRGGFRTINVDRGFTYFPKFL